MERVAQRVLDDFVPTIAGVCEFDHKEVLTGAARLDFPPKGELQ